MSKLTNQNGQALIQSLFALAVVMLVLEGAMPLGSIVNNLIAKMQFNSSVEGLKSTLVGISTNPELCQPPSGASWILPENSTGNWSSLFNGDTVSTTSGVNPNGIPVVVTTPFEDSSNNQIRLVQMTSARGTPDDSLIPPEPAGVTNPNTHGTIQWSGLNGSPALYINGLAFVPNSISGDPSYNPVTQVSPNYTVAGTLQFSVSSGEPGVLAATTMRTVASMNVMMDSSGNPLGCAVTYSPQETCAQYGGVWDPHNTPNCRFAFKSPPTSCPTGEYISQFNTDGSVVCSPITFLCPADSNGNLEALFGISGGSIDCMPINTTAPVIQFASPTSQTVPQGSGSPTIDVTMSVAQPMPITVTFNISSSTARAGVDYSTPTSDSVTFPAGATEENLGSTFTVLRSDSSSPVTLTITLASPPSPSSAAMIGPQNPYQLTISGATPCLAQSISWLDPTTHFTCSGSLPETSEGSSYPVTAASGESGSATFTCSSTGWTGPTSPICTAGVGGSLCPAQAASWTDPTSGNTCSSSLPSALVGSPFTVSATSGGTGTATYTCSSTGSWSGPTSPTCVNAPCTLTPLNWNCSVIPYMACIDPSGNLLVDTSNMTSYGSGTPPTCTVESCTENGASVGFTQENANPPYGSDELILQSMVPGFDSGWSAGYWVNVDSYWDGSEVEVDTVACDTPPATCATPPIWEGGGAGGSNSVACQINCVGGAYNGFNNITEQIPTSFAATSPPYPSGLPFTLTAADVGASSGENGSIIVSWGFTGDESDGADDYLDTFSYTCAASECPAQTLSWTDPSTGLACTGPVSIAALGSSFTTTATSGGIGSATFTCSSSGTWGYPPTGATCNAPECPAQALSWTDPSTGNDCSGTASETPDGSSTLVNASTGGSGSATFTCSSTGSWETSSPTDPTCAINSCPPSIPSNLGLCIQDEYSWGYTTLDECIDAVESHVAGYSFGWINASGDYVKGGDSSDTYVPVWIPPSGVTCTQALESCAAGVGTWNVSCSDSESDTAYIETTGGCPQGFAFSSPLYSGSPFPPQVYEPTASYNFTPDYFMESNAPFSAPTLATTTDPFGDPTTYGDCSTIVGPAACEDSVSGYQLYPPSGSINEVGPHCCSGAATFEGCTTYEGLANGEALCECQ